MQFLQNFKEILPKVTDNKHNKACNNQLHRITRWQYYYNQHQ